MLLLAINCLINCKTTSRSQGSSSTFYNTPLAVDFGNYLPLLMGCTAQMKMLISFLKIYTPMKTHILMGRSKQAAGRSSRPYTRYLEMCSCSVLRPSRHCTGEVGTGHGVFHWSRCPELDAPVTGADCMYLAAAAPSTPPHRTADMAAVMRIRCLCRPEHGNDLPKRK